MVAASEALVGEAPDSFWADRAFPFGRARPRPYLPVYELLNLLSEDDTRLVVQNNLVLKAPGPALGALFLYRSPAHSPGTEDGGRVEAPHSFDPQRIYPMLPGSVFEDGRLHVRNAAPDAAELLRRNDEAYEELFQALRKDAVSLTAEGAALVRSVYVAQVYSSRRQAFDALVEEGKPFKELKALPEIMARRAVDQSGAESIAAAVYGSKEALAFVSRWCSRRKQDAIAEALKRMEVAFAEGVADVGEMVDDRLAILDKVKAIVEADRLEAATPGGRGRMP
jgi:hypothetical protein